MARKLLNLPPHSPDKYLNIPLFIGGVITSTILSIGVLLGFGYKIPEIESLLDLLTVVALLLALSSLVLQYALPRLREEKELEETAEEIEYQREKLDRVRDILRHLPEEHEILELSEQERNKAEMKRKKTEQMINSAEYILNSKSIKELPNEEREKALSRLKNRVDLADEALEEYNSMILPHVK